jgi:hypothetical protein
LRIADGEFRLKEKARHTMKLKFSLANTRLTPALVLATLISLCSIQVRADTIALSFTGGQLSQFGDDATVGWAFNLSNPVLLTQLGVWDDAGNGLTQPHTVTIWDSTGTIVEAQAIVPSGTGAETNNFRYVTLTMPVLLAAGNYTIGAFYALNETGDAFAIDATTISTASGVTYSGSRAVVGNSFPSGDIGGQPNSYFGPNFQFTSASPSVPDPGSTLMLLLLGLTAVLGLGCVVRQQA